MKTIQKTTTVYKTDDGQEFLTKSEAEEHEKKLKYIRYFAVSANPDLIEGRHGPRPAGCIAVCANCDHAMFAEYACYKLFGNRVSFVQGVMGSNAIIDNWALDKSPESKPQGKIIATMQDQFADVKVFEVGFVDKRG